MMKKKKEERREKSEMGNGKCATYLYLWTDGMQVS